jgi:predicted GNAT family N-acyltransferase
MIAVRPLRLPEEAELLRGLRRRILYAGLPDSRAVYPGDEGPEVVHLGAFDEAGELVGIASLFPREDGTLQLRGMAVASDQQGTGVGAAIVRAAHEVATEQRRPSLWCNARIKAVGFYARQGWIVEGEEFEVPDVGPHYVMRWTPPRGGNS